MKEALDHHSLPDRDYLLHSYALTLDDLATLKQACRQISESRLVDEFYRWLENYPEYTEFFADVARLTRVKHGQRIYWRQFLDAEVDQHYVASRVHVGKIHARIKLGISIYCASMNFCSLWIRERLHEAGFSNQEEYSVSLGLERLCRLDVSLAVDAIAKEHARIIEEQGHALLELSTPTLQLWDEIVLLPLIGVIDSQRTAHIMEGLLNAIVDTSSTIAIVDVTGVPVIDTYVARHLIQTTQAARMLGAEVIFTGFSPVVAQTLTRLGVDLTTRHTAGSLRAGLRKAFVMTNHRIERRPLE